MEPLGICSHADYSWGLAAWGVGQGLSLMQVCSRGVARIHSTTPSLKRASFMPCAHMARFWLRHSSLIATTMHPLLHSSSYSKIRDIAKSKCDHFLLETRCNVDGALGNSWKFKMCIDVLILIQVPARPTQEGAQPTFLAPSLGHQRWAESSYTNSTSRVS